MQRLDIFVPPRVQKEGCTCAVCSADRSAYTPPAWISCHLCKQEPDGTQRPLTPEELEEFCNKHKDVAEYFGKASKPIPEQDWYKKCSFILEKLLSDSRFSEAFAHPVDPVALNIPDYPSIILHPMDLGTIKTKLENHEYDHPDDFIDDVRLVFRNCYVYNKSESAVYKWGAKLSRTFESALMKVRGGKRI